MYDPNYKIIATTKIPYIEKFYVVTENIIVEYDIILSYTKCYTGGFEFPSDVFPIGQTICFPFQKKIYTEADVNRKIKMDSLKIIFALFLSFFSLINGSPNCNSKYAYRIVISDDCRTVWMCRRPGMSAMKLTDCPEGSVVGRGARCVPEGSSLNICTVKHVKSECLSCILNTLIANTMKRSFKYFVLKVLVNKWCLNI